MSPMLCLHLQKKWGSHHIGPKENKVFFKKKDYSSHFMFILDRKAVIQYQDETFVSLKARLKTIHFSVVFTVEHN